MVTTSMVLWPFSWKKEKKKKIPANIIEFLYLLSLALNSKVDKCWALGIRRQLYLCDTPSKVAWRHVTWSCACRSWMYLTLFVLYFIKYELPGLFLTNKEDCNHTYSTLCCTGTWRIIVKTRLIFWQQKGTSRFC